MKKQCSHWRFAAISASALSPFARSFSLLYSNSSRVSVENSWFCAEMEQMLIGSFPTRNNNGETHSQRWHQQDMLPGRSRSRYTLSYRYLRQMSAARDYVWSVNNEPYLVVLLDPSWRASLSIVIAWAGQIASHSLQALRDVSIYCGRSSNGWLANTTFLAARVTAQGMLATKTRW